MKAIWSTLFAAVACATTAFAGDSFPGTFDIFSFDPAEGTTAKLDFINVYTVPRDSFYVLSTVPGSVDWQGLTLTDGVIKTIPPPGYLGPVGSIGAVTIQSSYPFTSPGPFPAWANVPEPTSSELWTAADNHDGTSILSLSGFSNLFSLCESSFLQGPAPEIPAVVFNASSDAIRDGPSTYDGSSCVPITLLAIARR